MKAEVIAVRGTSLESVSAGSGRPIVFFHGSEGIQTCAPMLERLSTLGRVFAPSHPGFGRTPRPANIRTVDDLAYFYLDVFDQFEIEGPLLIGANFGAWIAAEIAVRDSSRISGLVLASPVGARFATDECAVEIQDIFTMDRAEEERRTWVHPEQRLKKHSSLSDAELMTLVKDRETLCNFTWAPYMHSPLLSRWLHRIKTPALVISGAEDGITPPEYGRTYAAAIPDCRFEVINGAAHMPHVEQVDQFTGTVADFVSLETSAAA